MEDIIIWGNFLELIDPDSYAEPPEPTGIEQLTIKKSGRICVMAARYESDGAIWSRDDVPPDRYKNGARLTTTRNGEDVFQGSAEAPETTWRGRAAS